MEIELDSNDPAQKKAVLSTLPRFNGAETQRQRLLNLILASAAASAVLLLAAVKSDIPLVRSLLSFNSAALLLLARAKTKGRVITGGVLLGLGRGDGVAFEAGTV